MVFTSEVPEAAGEDYGGNRLCRSVTQETGASVLQKHIMCSGCPSFILQSVCFIESTVVAVIQDCKTGSD